FGWSYDDKTEYFNREELIRVFTLERVGVSAGIYDPDKLLWMNGIYIRQLSLDELVQRALPYMERPEAEGGLPDSVARPLDIEYTKRVLRLEHERLKTLGEAAHVVSFFYTDDLVYDTAMLIQKGMDAARTHDALVKARNVLERLEEWKHDTIEPTMRDLAMELGLKPAQLSRASGVAPSG